MTKRFWISWIQKTTDFRPMTDPPTPEVLGWWCSGYMDAGGDSIDLMHAILCAVVEADDERDAQDIIYTNWTGADKSEIGEFRFCEEKPDDWKPGSRFPITSDWERERFREVL